MGELGVPRSGKSDAWRSDDYSTSRAADRRLCWVLKARLGANQTSDEDRSVPGLCVADCAGQTVLAGRSAGAFGQRQVTTATPAVLDFSRTTVPGEGFADAMPAGSPCSVARAGSPAQDQRSLSARAPCATVAFLPSLRMALRCGARTQIGPAAAEGGGSGRHLSTEGVSKLVDKPMDNRSCAAPAGA